MSAVCELFGLSCSEPDRATRALPVFADQGSWCRDGWGIGYFRGAEARFVKSKEAVKTGQTIHAVFFDTVQKAKSAIIIAHVRAATSEHRDDCDAHPFSIRCLERDWLFAHNGSIPNLEKRDYPSRTNPPSVIDSARAFTYLMDRLQEYTSQMGLRGIYPGIKWAIRRLRREFDGAMNFLMSDGDNLYVFHDRACTPMHFLCRSKPYGPAFLVTTLGGQKRLTDEAWQEMPANRLLVVNRGQVLVLGSEQS